MSHSNGHDIFVKDVMSEKKYALEILKTSLPVLETFQLSPEERNIFSKYIPDFTYALFDLNMEDVGHLDTIVVIKSILFVLKNIWQLESENILREFISLSGELFFDEKQQKILEKMILYMYLTTEIEPEKLEKLVSEITQDEKSGDFVMTTAIRLEKKGRQEGLKKRAAFSQTRRC